jgi:hypothetical protein
MAALAQCLGISQALAVERLALAIGHRVQRMRLDVGEAEISHGSTLLQAWLDATWSSVASQNRQHGEEI